jgi:phage antirepressor YoqD-like protein
MNNAQVFQYNGNPVTFRTGDATMVNATQMAKPFGDSKRAKNWLILNQTSEFLEVLSKGRNLPLDDLVQVTKGGTNPGSWMHEDVAIEFARWLSPQFAIWCNDRIKELIKYGITATPQTIDNILADPGNAIKVLTALQAERKKTAQLEDANKCYQSEVRRLCRLKDKQDKQLEQQAPKVEYAENVLSSADTYTTTQIAKELGMSAQKLNATLYHLGIQFFQGGQWFMYAKYQDKGYTKSKTYTYNKKDGRVGTMLATVWTEAGRMFIHNLIKKI